MKKILIKDIMTDKITVASLHHKFSQVMEVFNTSNLRHLPVTDADQVIGIISMRDVMKELYSQLSTGQPVTMQQMDELFRISDMMTPTPVTVSPETDMEEAVAIFLGGGFHALPVTENDVIKGIVTHYDLMKAYYKDNHPPVHYSSGAPGFGV